VPTTRLVRNGVGHPRPEVLVHWDAAVGRTPSALPTRSGRRWSAPVITPAEREAEDELRQSAAPPLGLLRTAVAAADLWRRTYRDWRRRGRADLVHTREGIGGDGVQRTTSAKVDRAESSSLSSSESAHRNCL
jgi:hypothetical protein